jgi:hypothetical protein
MGLFRRFGARDSEGLEWRGYALRRSPSCHIAACHICALRSGEWFPVDAGLAFTASRNGLTLIAEVVPGAFFRPHVPRG